MKVKDKENFNNPLKGWRILSAISSMVFHTVQWSCLSVYRSVFIYRTWVLPHTDCFLINLSIPVNVYQVIVSNRHSSPYDIYILPKMVGFLVWLLWPFFSLQFSMSVGLFSDHVEHVECSVEPQCTVNPLLTSPAASSSTPPQLLPWSIQDDQDDRDVSLHMIKMKNLPISPFKPWRFSWL